MIAVFQNYLRVMTPLTEADIQQVCALAIQRKLRRQELLLSPGEICRYKAFVATGMLRIYTMKEDGSEHILNFSPEETWTLDAESYDQQMPSNCYIDAVENSEVLLWHKTDFDRLLAELPQLQIYAGRIISQAIHSSRRRLVTVLSGSPEEKYEDFIRTYPGLLSRLPLRMIASYLGISLKTLTRLRSAQLQRL